MHACVCAYICSWTIPPTHIGPMDVSGGSTCALSSYLPLFSAWDSQGAHLTLSLAELTVLSYSVSALFMWVWRALKSH